MTIIHTRKRENPFVQIDKSIFNNVNISWKAKGLLGYLLSKPDSWQTYVADLEKRSTDGRDSTRTGIQELIKAGYIERKEVRNKGRFKGYDYIVHEIPMQVTENGKSENGKTENGKTDVGKTDFGKPATSNNDLSNNDLSNNDLNNNNKDNSPFSSSSKKESKKKSLLTTEEQEVCKQVIDYLNEKASKRFRTTTAETQRLIKKRLEEEYTITDFKRVVDVKTSEWMNTEWERYLQPSTLFSDKNFEKYLNQPLKKSTKRVNDPNDYGPEYFDNQNQPSKVESQYDDLF